MKIVIIKKKRQLFCVESINFLYTLSVDAVFLLINPRVISFDWSLCKHLRRRKTQVQIRSVTPECVSACRPLGGGREFANRLISPFLLVFRVAVYLLECRCKWIIRLHVFSGLEKQLSVCKLLKLFW